MDVQVSLDASQLVEPDEWEDIPMDMAARIGNIFITSQTLRSSFEVPATNATRFIFSARTMLSNRSAGSVLHGTLRHRFNDHIDLSLSSSLFSASPVVVAKAGYALSDSSFAEVSATSRTLSRPPTCNVSTGTAISPTWTSFASFNTGQYALGEWGAGAPFSITGLPSVNVGLSGGRGWVITTDVSQAQTTLSLQWAQKVWGNFRVRLATAIATAGGFSVNCEGSAKGPLDIHTSTTVALGTSGVILKLKYALSALPTPRTAFLKSNTLLSSGLPDWASL